MANNDDNYYDHGDNGDDNDNVKDGDNVRAGDDYGGDNDKEEEEEGETTKARGRGSPCNYGEYFMWSISKEIWMAMIPLDVIVIVPSETPFI